eukprot:g8741.t1
MCEEPVVHCCHSSHATRSFHERSFRRISSSAPCNHRHGIVPSISKKWNNSMIPVPETTDSIKEQTSSRSFQLNDLPPGVILGILRNLSRMNVKDPVRLSAVSRNCHEAFNALKESDKEFNETLKIFRGDYDNHGGFKTSKTKNRYRIRRLANMQLTQW